MASSDTTTAVFVTTATGPFTGRVDDTTEIVLGAVLGIGLFSGAFALFVWFLRWLQAREDRKNAADFSAMTVEKPVYSFDNPAAEVPAETGPFDIESGEPGKPRSSSQRSERLQSKASISDHDVVVGSMKGLSGMPSETPVVVETIEEAEANDLITVDDDDAVERLDKVEAQRGIQRGGPRGATVAVVHVEPSEFEEAVRMARKPSPSVKVRPTFSNGDEPPSQ